MIITEEQLELLIKRYKVQRRKIKRETIKTVYKTLYRKNKNQELKE